MADTTAVTVVGLGAMGAAIARALLAGDVPLTVWNRGGQRREAFRDSGARIAGSIEAALTASPLCIVCVADYDATWAMLDQAGEAARGRTYVQFSTGTPGEARQGQRWAGAHDGAWLDGAILAYPREISDDALIYVAGDTPAFESCKGYLDCLTSDLRYLGPAVGAAAALDLAVLSYYACTHLGLVHGALVCESEGVPVGQLGRVIVDSLPSDIDETRHLSEALATGRFDEPGASLSVYHGVLQRVLAQAKDVDLNDEIPRFAEGLLDRGMQAGLADEEVVALVKLLRQRQKPPG